MLNQQNLKFVNVLDGATVATTTASAQFDTLGAHEVAIFVRQVGVTAATSAAKLATLALYESDSTSSEGTAIPLFTGTTNTVTTTSDGFLITANTSTTTVSTGVKYKFVLTQNPPRKRYISVRYAAGATTDRTLAIWAELGRLEQSPSNATEAGVSVLAVG